MRISDWSSDVCSSDLSDVHPAFKPLFGTTAYLEDEAIIGKTKDAARSSLRGLFERADTQLAANDWIAGSRSIADPYLYVVTRWAKAQGVDLSGLDNLARFAARMERSEEHTSELQSIMSTSYAVFCLNKKTANNTQTQHT